MNFNWYQLLAYRIFSRYTQQSGYRHEEKLLESSKYNKESRLQDNGVGGKQVWEMNFFPSLISEMKFSSDTRIVNNAYYILKTPSELKL